MNTSEITPHTTESSSQQPVRALLARAGLLRWLAAGFFYPLPQQASRWQQQYQSLDQALLAHLLPAAILEQATAVIEQGTALAEGFLAEDYSRLFLGQSAIPLRETAYSDARRLAGRSSELADINGFYLAFGLEMSQDAADAADNISAELEFLSALLIKEAFALDNGAEMGEALTVTQMACAAFLREHLGIWTGPLQAALEEVAPESPYTALAQLIAVVIDWECQTRAVEPIVLGQRAPDFMQDEEFVCPMANNNSEPSETRH